MDDNGPRHAHVLQHDIDLILQIGLQINAEHDVDRLLNLTVQAIKESLKYAYCAILLKEGTGLVIRAVTEYPEDIIGNRLPIGTGLTGRCALSWVESLVPELSKSPHYVLVLLRFPVALDGDRRDQMIRRLPGQSHEADTQFVLLELDGPAGRDQPRGLHGNQQPGGRASPSRAPRWASAGSVWRTAHTR